VWTGASYVQIKDINKEIIMRLIRPKNGDIKIKDKFALLPVSIGREIRWLEWVTIKYQYWYGYWEIVSFIDKETK
jgi:hypothetical protein